MRQVLAMGDQALMQMAREQRDALRPRVVPEEVAGHAHLAAAAGAQHGLIQPGPVLERLVAGGLQAGEGNGDHGDLQGVHPYWQGGGFPPGKGLRIAPSAKTFGVSLSSRHRIESASSLRLQS